MPAEFTNCDWEKYEERPLMLAAEWLRQRESPVLIDIGSQLGIYCLLALSVSPTAMCIAIDSDLSSIRAMKRMCRFANAGRRLKLIWGFMTETSDQPGNTLDDATSLTAEALARSSCHRRSLQHSIRLPADGWPRPLHSSVEHRPVVYRDVPRKRADQVRR